MTEWIIPGNPKFYDVIGAFHKLEKIDWSQKANFEIGDIVYIYVSGDVRAIQFKCIVNKINLEYLEIDDQEFNISGKYDGTAGRYMELELLEEYAGEEYKRGELLKYGFRSPQSPRRITEAEKQYLDSLSNKYTNEIDLGKVEAFINKYAGEQYVKPENASADQKTNMTALRKKGQEARQILEKYAENVCRSFPEMKIFGCSNWIDQNQIVPPYLWIRLKKIGKEKLPYSISLAMIHNTNDDTVLSFRIEIEDKGRKKEEYVRHNTQIDLPLPDDDDIYYEITDKSDNNYNYLKNREKVKSGIENDEIKKVKVVRDLSKPYNPERYEELVTKGVETVNLLMPFYEHVVDDMEQMNDLLRNFFERFINEYPTEKTKPKKNNLFEKYISEESKHIFFETSIVSADDYTTKGGVGNGRWAAVPWVAIFNKQVTSTAKEGKYIVYLLSNDHKTLYLTFNQGGEKIEEREGKKKALEILKSEATKLRTSLDSKGFSTGDIDLYCPGNERVQKYEAGCVFSKAYTIDTLPDEKELRDDLKKMVEIYENYIVTMTSNSNSTSNNNLEKPMDINTKDALTKITEYIAARGFTYSGNLIENFYLSLKSKPFVILAGTSGTGKTRLVKLFAEAIGAEYKLVPVRPDWSDGSDLFGHYDLNGNFVEGPVCECFAFANANPNKPVILCLDEMNLARVEYYLSDFLSVIESREKNEDGSVYTTPIAQFEKGIPNNLYIVGTVNMDETTFPFSKKVLDRANTIEFSYVELTPYFEAADSVPEPLVLANDFLKAQYLVLGRDCADEQEFVTDICSTLQEINEILKKANAHVGYRVRDEIVFYMLNNKKAGNLLSDDEAMDNEIMQKILPRIQGSSSAIRSLLIDLYNFCSNNDKKVDGNEIDVASGMKKNAASAKYPKSAEKIGYMMTRFEDDGFTSYWL